MAFIALSISPYFFTFAVKAKIYLIILLFFQFDFDWLNRIIPDCLSMKRKKESIEFLLNIFLEQANMINN